MAKTASENSIAPLRVFYDGSCIVCSREIRYYQTRSDDLILVDISHPGFDAQAYGRSLDQFMAQLHVLDDCGSWYVGIEAFQVIWTVVPGRIYDQLAGLVGWPVLRPLAEYSYKLFARYRGYLPRSKRSCDGDSCQRG